MNDETALEATVKRLSERVNRLESEMREVKRDADNALCAHVAAGNY